MIKNNDFTEGAILPKLIKFMLPVLFAMFLQAMYGAVDLLVVGKFGTNADVSAVSSGSQIVFTLTNLVVSFAMGITVSVGQEIGRRAPDSAANSIGTGIILFTVVGAVFTVISIIFAPLFATVLNAPDEAFDRTVQYTRICGAGFLIICAYNIIGSIFRGIGDAKTPLISVGIACVANIVGDLVLVSVFDMGAAGAAYATVGAQLISVIVSLIFIAKSKLPFKFTRANLRLNKLSLRQITAIGTPIALQDFLVGISFLVLLAIVNGLGLTASAGVGVSEKVCAFIMLVPSAFMQSMSSFVAQNVGAGKPERSEKALRDGIAVSVAFGVAMFFCAFFFGDVLASIFSKDADVIAAAFSYLKAYAIDCLLTCFLFCFIGYYNGIGKTSFVMIQGIVGAFCVRIPVAFVMNKFGGGSLFLIGLSTPCSTVVQIAMCFVALLLYNKKQNGKNSANSQFDF